MVEEVAFVAKSQESENTMSKAPIFTSRKLFDVCKGPIFFGHIHQRTTVKKRLFYPGSFTRWKHGEEEEKGWYLCAYNKEDGTFTNQFIENKKAPVYITVSVDITEENAKSPEDIVSTIKKIPADYIKLVIRTGEIDANFAIQYINGVFKNNSNIKVEVKDIIKEKHDLHEEEIMDELMNKYDFIFKDGMDIYDIIQSFITHSMIPFALFDFAYAADMLFLSTERCIQENIQQLNCFFLINDSCSKTQYICIIVASCCLRAEFV